MTVQTNNGILYNGEKGCASVIANKYESVKQNDMKLKYSMKEYLLYDFIYMFTFRQNKLICILKWNVFSV